MRNHVSESTTSDIVLHNSSMTVSLVKKKASARLTSKLTPIKCYRGDLEKNEHSFYESVLPIVVIEPHAKYNDNELYDFTSTVHLSHGEHMSDENNTPMTPLEFRRRRPDLDQVFNIDALTPLYAEVPVLGFHYELADLETAHNMAIGIFRRLLETDLTDNNVITLLSYKLYYDYTAMSGTPVNAGQGTILPVAFRDELKQHVGVLVKELETALTLEVEESRHGRTGTIAQVVNNWIGNSSIKRIAERILDTPLQYLSLIGFVMTAFVEDKLEQAIYEVIKTT